MTDETIIMLGIDEVIPYDNNPRQNDEAVDLVANSIREFGFKQPIVVDSNRIIIAGHTRWKAAKKLGLKEVPVIIASDLTEEQARAYRLADNKVAEAALWDYDKLDQELAAILDIDMSEFGFTDEGDDLLDDPFEIVEDEAPEVDMDAEPVVKLGEIWRCGDHVLLCGDATDEDQVRRLVAEGGGQVDIVITDPPYGIDVVNKDGNVGAPNLVKCNTYAPVIGDSSTNTAEKSYNILKNISDKLIIWGGNYFIDFLEHSDSWIIWDKRGEITSNNFADGEMAYCSFHTPLRIFRQVWMGMVREGEHDRRVHPTQKPVRMLSQIIDRFTDSDDTVLDVFGGSGSTMIACEQTGRRCLMMELDPHYCDVIIQRWEQLTGQQAELVSG